MQFSVTTDSPATRATGCVILPLFENGPLAAATQSVDESCGGVLGRLVESGDASAMPGRTRLLPGLEGIAAERVLLTGCGKEDAFNAKALNGAVAAAAQALGETGVTDATSYLTRGGAAGVDAYYAARITVAAASGALYRFDELKSDAPENAKLSRFAIAAGASGDASEAERGATHGQAIASGVSLARDLGNRPPNVCTPSHLADEARALAERFGRLETEVLDEDEMQNLGMGALLSVTNGAEEPARLIVMQYRGADDKTAPVAICGKGITFDTGGISIKPSAKMDEMKFDMCGAASVLGAMAAIGELQPPINVVGVVPACENMPGGRATRPGDIVTSMSGKTVEVLNTDAEGRLILCDAMTFASRYEPRYLLDVATLTGACVVAVGHLYTGLFANDEDLAADLMEAGKRSLDPAWRLPVDDEYGEGLRSNFADFANIGGRFAGASVAAQFLSRFVDGTPWAHLDIAGAAWHPSGKQKGATGRPVPLLVDFLLNLK
ncbi:MAG: leucyl aminopeptidase [Proteobacteria bacterium]|nr:leucyl aminopeptidase [Pseudomonadota bacterium]